MSNVHTMIACLFLAGTLAQTGLADEAGKAAYMDSCASCHGENADGMGPMAEYLTLAVPPLTGLSAANDGVFPMLKVIHTIDGRQSVKGHGDPMPVWGRRFKEEMSNTGPYGAEPLIRGQVLSIAYYLESIQE